MHCNVFPVSIQPLVAEVRVYYFYFHLPRKMRHNRKARTSDFISNISAVSNVK